MKTLIYSNSFTFFNYFIDFQEILLYTIRNSIMEGGATMTVNDLIALLVMLVIVLCHGNNDKH